MPFSKCNLVGYLIQFLLFLGLCQTFLILLYCRNYLRKSRHLESDGQIPCSFGSTPTMRPDTLVETECTTAPATPRDILSFAWQISKGMAYLSDIKVCTTDPDIINISGKINCLPYTIWSYNSGKIKT